MLSIPGVGVVTIAGFLAEVGDINSYDHGQQIIRLAGLNLVENRVRMILCINSITQIEDKIVGRSRAVETIK
ncbi:hypothetical protein GCM10008018_17930 [Paenibacillus marchantiophytorum]|uniref:Transposase IS116/IS110/IS902 C-terminal domain-containing protein n=1 Tax=Paenibacillus marchantiophytorum TaxID=1619310 RepID=A0ABQ2BSL5_9BACL|nr:hypothetical protein GCM10008018_17930 [Paenibacillus marchantiophytorum]